MKKEEIFKLITENPAFFLATVEDDQPKVRGMLLYKADEDGIIFHTGSMKDLYGQVLKNPKVELCFNGNGSQVRISGTLEIIDDNNFKDEICNHPSRKFLQAWRESKELKDFYKELIVFRLKNGTATTWTMATNFASKEFIQL
ncbi:pyridoxamine 5'-phosphate oxidase family protein [Clostridium cellulovorans]|uniref:Pyridoxamine 5'-phosphate oxidase-related FMN-binding n=1 Tax=Clostridium cellulovorans (strain ATCC 35296 / DSM 3052 / OCM 3 / 743B) TaxID=573061 RepID=D9SLT2_CLOC7|nr:pyridoxamine 5'-phosphate oxidase family protein [Clostridium cellulovorans]ADL53719.1 pyridoxamine 5'-phosphate oxidase-related FMN-binding [Clostridium cellulovorans 743B]